MRFEVKKKLSTNSERVKCIEFHLELPWILSAMYSGNITIYDYSNQTAVKSIEVSQSPCRCAKFISRKQWIVAGSDDLKVRIFNYNTTELVNIFIQIKTFEAHQDYLRHIMVHPSLPYIFTCSDDASIRIFDFEQNFQQVATFSDHQHYVMQMALNPRDHQLFASASLDKTVKIWNIQNKKKALYTLNGHQEGVNCVDFFKGDKPYLISGGDDLLVKIWDYQIKQCLHTLEGHTNNISSVFFHPDFPIILTAAEDGQVKFWNSNTYRLEQNFNNRKALQLDMERVWGLDVVKNNSNVIGIAYDEGTVVIKIGSDEPVITMNNGKLIMAKNMELFTSNLKSLSPKEEIQDNEKMDINTKELGQSDIYPLAICHSPNGHLFSINNENEYAIYRSQTFKSQGFGQGMDVVWAPTNDFAVRENNLIRIIKSQNNQEIYSFSTDYKIEQLHGGPLLCVRNSEFLVFYDWTSGIFITKIDINAKKIYWNEVGTQMVVATKDEFFVLSFQKEMIKQLIASEAIDPEEGVENAFLLEHTIPDIITSGIWVNGIFFYVNQSGKILYTLKDRTFAYGYTDKKKFLIGYIQNQNRLYLIDKHLNLVSIELDSILCDYKLAIIQDDLDSSRQLLEQIPEKYHNNLAKFLDQIDLKEEALFIVKDMEHKFDLAIQLNQIDLALEIANKQENQGKLKQVGDLALLMGKISMAESCFLTANDFNSLLLIYSSLGQKEKLREVARKCESSKTNIAFSSYFLLGDVDKCIDVLVQAERIPEAAIFARTYAPSHIQELTMKWKQFLQNKGCIVSSEKIADIFSFPELESELQTGLEIEKYIKEYRQDVPSHQYEEYNQILSQDFYSMVKEGQQLTEIPLSIEVQEQNPCLQEIHFNNE